MVPARWNHFDDLAWNVGKMPGFWVAAKCAARFPPRKASARSCGSSLTQPLARFTCSLFSPGRIRKGCAPRRKFSIWGAFSPGRAGRRPAINTSWAPPNLLLDVRSTLINSGGPTDHLSSIRAAFGRPSDRSSRASGCCKQPSKYILIAMEPSVPLLFRAGRVWFWADFRPKVPWNDKIISGPFVRKSTAAKMWMSK